MKLTIKKTIEETIEINDLPKYYKTIAWGKFFKLTEDSLIIVGEKSIFKFVKGGQYFDGEVFTAIKYDEATEAEYQEHLNNTINHFKSI